MTDKKSRETLKSEKLRRLCIEYKIDLACLAEINKDWREVEQDHSIWNATAPWKESRLFQVANNTTKPKLGLALRNHNTRIYGRY